MLKRMFGVVKAVFMWIAMVICMALRELWDLIWRVYETPMRIRKRYRTVTYVGKHQFTGDEG